MPTPHRVIPIRPLPARVPVAAQGRPVLQGDRQALARVMRALRAVPELADTRRVRRLRVADGEAELTLVERSDALVAELAFRTLRHTLPDTDIYVHRAAA